MAKVRFIQSREMLGKKRAGIWEGIYEKIKTFDYDTLNALQNQLLEGYWDEEILGTFQGNDIATLAIGCVEYEIKRRLGV